MLGADNRCCSAIVGFLTIVGSVRHPTRTLLTAAMLLSLLATAGCAGATTEPTAGPTPGGTPSTPGAEPTGMPGDPDTTDPADPATWIADFEGIGPIRLGERVSDVAPRLGAFERVELPTDCNLASFRGSGALDRLAVSMVSDPSDLETIIQVFVMTAGDPKAPPAVSPRTEAGIELGASEAQLLAAHPDAVPLEDNEAYAIYEIATGDGAFLYFLVSRPDYGAVGPAEFVYGIVSSAVPGVGPDYCL